MNTVSQEPFSEISFGEKVYRYFYGVGVHTRRLTRRIGRGLDRLTKPMRRWMRYHWHWVRVLTRG